MLFFSLRSDFVSLLGDFKAREIFAENNPEKSRKYIFQFRKVYSVSILGGEAGERHAWAVEAYIVSTSRVQAGFLKGDSSPHFHFYVMRENEVEKDDQVDVHSYPTQQFQFQLVNPQFYSSEIILENK